MSPTPSSNSPLPTPPPPWLAAGPIQARGAVLAAQRRHDLHKVLPRAQFRDAKALDTPAASTLRFFGSLTQPRVGAGTGAEMFERRWWEGVSDRDS